MLYALHGESHAARASRNGTHCGIHIGGGQIRHLSFCDFFRLLAGQLAHLVGVRRFAALLHTGGLLDQNARRRGLHDEGEALVRECGDHHRNRQTRFHTLGLRVERLAELHDVQSALTQRRTDRWTWICLACRHLQLDIADDFFCHVTLLISGLNAYRCCYSGTLPVQNREGRRGRGNLGRGKREGGRVKPLARRYPSPFTLTPSLLPTSPLSLPPLPAS